MMDYQKYIKEINYQIKKYKYLFQKYKHLYLKKAKIQYIKKLDQVSTNKIYGALLCLMVFISFYEKPETKEVLSSVDTIIPQGHVLIPIEIANVEVLENLLGSFGVVNLYTFSPYTQKPSKLIVKNIKIIESPKKNGHYAVLTPDEKAKFILSHPQPFFIAIKNPNEKESEFKTKKKNVKRVIEIIDD